MKKGFTLIEMLVAIAIVILIIGGTLSAFVSLKNNQSVDKSANLVRSEVEKARSETISSTGNAVYGIHFDAGGMTLFQGASYTPGDPNNQTVAFNGAVLSTIDLTAGVSDVVFSRVTGEASVGGTLVMSSVANASASTTLTLYTSGIIQ